jgi:hypothetical protein
MNTRATRSDWCGAKRTRGNALYSLPPGRFIVTKFSRAAWDAASGSGVQFFTRGFKLRTLFETKEFPGVTHCAGVESISWGVKPGNPKIHGKMAGRQKPVCARENVKDLLRSFLREKPAAKKLETKPQ